MSQVHRRTGFSGPTLVRLLARLADADAPDPGPSLSDQLGHWLGWTDAIALSAALTADPPAVPPHAPAFGGAEELECARVRDALTKAIIDDSGSPNRRRGPARHVAPPQPLDPSDGFSPYRQRYLLLQQSMETRIGALRGRLRTVLAARTGGMTRLAMVDAVMERVLGAREQSLLATVPAMLEARFQRLRQSGETTLARQAAGESAAIAAGAWLAVFRGEMQSVLLAELEVRFQPVDALLEALRASQPNRNS